jgi:hypothetical protein
MVVKLFCLCSILSFAEQECNIHVFKIHTISTFLFLSTHCIHSFNKNIFNTQWDR